MKKIAVITGTRAEYGLTKPLIQKIKDDDQLELLLVVTGTHLMSEFGNTYKNIIKDGFQIHAKIKDGLKGDSSFSITKAMAKGMVGFVEAYEALKPDLIIVLGDRSEILAAVTAAAVSKIPVAHLHGGETTEGAYDEYFRHAITKMSFLHFTATETYRKRVIQLGEHPDRVFNVGAIGIDSINNLELLPRAEFEKAIDFKLKKNNVLITFHPVTLEKNTAELQFNELLISLDKLKDIAMIFTKPNSDVGGKIIIKMIDQYVLKNKSKAISFDSLGQLRYLSALQYVDVVIGNSSSGIYEAPIFKIPTINIGDRQKGRLMPQSVINCLPTSTEIDNALLKAFDLDFKTSIKSQENIFGNGTASAQVIKIIKSFEKVSLKKSFYDITFDING
jgi:GDP/UDP-N,N'-diacetylbacillosamine 2-epimerase (hydrolysing)